MSALLFGVVLVYRRLLFLFWIHFLMIYAYVLILAANYDVVPRRCPGGREECRPGGIWISIHQSCRTGGMVARFHSSVSGEEYGNR